MKYIRITIVALIFIALFAVAKNASADTHTWDGSDSIYWGTGANWTSGIAPVTNDDLVFPAGAANKSTNNNIAADTYFGSITVQETGYAIAGNNFYLNSNLTLTKGTLQISTVIGGISGNVIIGTDASNTGTITIDSGKFVWLDPGGTRTLTIYDGSTLTGQGTFGVYGALTSNSIIMDLRGNYTIDIAAFAYYYFGWLSSGTYTPTIAAATYGGDLIITVDNWYAGTTYNYILAGDVAVLGNLYLGIDGDALVLTSLSTSTYDLSVSGNFTVGPNSSTIFNRCFFIGGSGKLDINGNLTIRKGAKETVSFTAPSGTAADSFTLAGDYSNTTKFIHNSGTLTLDGSTAPQTLSGNMTGDSDFYNLTITNANGTAPSDDEITDFVPSVYFQDSAKIDGTYTIATQGAKVKYGSGKTYTFKNINWNGQASNGIYFRNSAASGSWKLDVIGNQTAVANINVSRSDAGGSEFINVSGGTNHDGGNNTNWRFSANSAASTLFRLGSNVFFRTLVNFRK